MEENRRSAILYVDDEEVNLFLFKVTFEGKYTVFTAPSGSKALEELEDHNDEIVAVISDMRMPLMNGIEFVKKAREKYDNIGYFILSGYEHNDEINDAVKEKVIRQIFTKPLETDEIDSAIQQFIKNDS